MFTHEFDKTAVSIHAASKVFARNVQDEPLVKQLVGTFYKEHGNKWFDAFKKSKPEDHATAIMLHLDPHMKDPNFHQERAKAVHALKQSWKSDPVLRGAMSISRLEKQVKNLHTKHMMDGKAAGNA